MSFKHVDNARLPQSYFKNVEKSRSDDQLLNMDKS